MTRLLAPLLLLVPLAELPGAGFDVLRLPVALALGAALLATGRVRAPGLALTAFAAVYALSLAVTPDPAAGALAVLSIATAWAACAGSADRSDAEKALALAAGALLIGAAWTPSSLLGNSNYAGAFAGMLLAALAAAPKNPFAWAGATAAALVLALSGSRGGAAGAAAGLAVAAVLLWREGRRRAALVLAAGVLLAAALIPFFAPKVFSADTLIVRAEVWKGALRMGAERPWLGAGAGGFGASFPPYRSEVEARITQRNEQGGFSEVDNAHSSWIQSFADAGVPGALAWLVLVAAMVLRVLKAKPGEAGWAGAAAAFLAAGLFNTLTSQVSHLVLFGAALGFLQGDERKVLPDPVRWAVAGLLGLGALGAATRIGPELAYAGAAALPTPEAREKALRAGENWRFRFRLGEELTRQGRHREAAEAYRAALKDRPFHAVSLNNLAVALLRSGAPKAEAAAILRRAEEVAPHYAMTSFNLGLLRFEERALEEARSLFTRAAGLRDAHAGARYGIAETWLAAGDVEQALPHLRAARERGLDVGAALRRDHPSYNGDPRLAEFSR